MSLESPSKACKLNSHECDSYFYLSKSIEFGSFNWICKHWCFFWIHSLQLVQWFAHPASCLIAIFHSLFFDRYNWSHSEFSSNCYSDHFAINLKHERQKDAQLITVSVSARRLTQLKNFQSIIRFNLDISGYYSRAMTNQTKWKEKTNNQFQSVVFNRFFSHTGRVHECAQEFWTVAILLLASNYFRWIIICLIVWSYDRNVHLTLSKVNRFNSTFCWIHFSNRMR